MSVAKKTNEIAVNPDQPDETPNLPVNAQTASVMSMIERVASDPAFDVGKLEKLMDLQERILDRNAKEAFSADFVRMKPNLPKIVRTKNNSQTKSKYAPLEDINVIIDPILQPYGFATSTKIVAQDDTSVTVKAELWHSGGHVEETTIKIPLDKTGIAGTVNKTLPHATSSSVTYGKRIAICALLNISTGDDKDGNQDTGFITIEQAADIDLRARALGDKNHKNLMDFMQVSSAPEIPAKEYKKALNALTGMEAEANRRRAEKAKP